MTQRDEPHPSFTPRPLDPSTWPNFAALVEENNGI